MHSFPLIYVYIPTYECTYICCVHYFSPPPAPHCSVELAVKLSSVNIRSQWTPVVKGDYWNWILELASRSEYTFPTSTAIAYTPVV